MVQAIHLTRLNKSKATRSTCYGHLLQVQMKRFDVCIIQRQLQGTVKRPLCPKDFQEDSSLNKCNFSTKGSKISASSSGAKAMQMLNS